jgi:hypothetical protein
MVIEQYPIAATPKYNFPQSTMETMLPQHFIELSIYSLKHAQTQPFQLNQQAFQQVGDLTECPQSLRLKPTPIRLNPKQKENVVAAVDTSTIKLGETSTGMVIAVRGANVWKQSGKYRYLRFGPFIFHITEENKKEVFNTLESAYFSLPYGYNHHGAPGFLQMPTRIAALLERWLQAMLSKTLENGIILFDGSLTSGTPDSPVQHLKGILATARKKGNTVLAFSKATSIRVNGHLITDLLPEREPPYLLETTGLKLKPPLVLLGDMYVARLTKGNFAFRLDIDSCLTPELKIDGVERLLGNDLLYQSYPETLRLAHILCTFTANEVLAMQHFVACKHRLRIVNRPDMHRILFGPFGRGESFS